jgi:N-acetylglucosamine-6-phosphate deacetylase
VPDSFLIENCDLVLPDRVIRSGALLVSQGKIVFAGLTDRLTGPIPAGCRRVSGEGLLACPAFWEMHLHGCGGIGTESMSQESLVAMAGFLAQQGVGAFLPTTVPDEAYLAHLGESLEAAEDRLLGRIPGIYVEGPFVSSTHRGGIPEGLLRKPAAQYLDRLVSISRGKIRMMTFAPELPGSAAILSRLQTMGILPAIGHSTATFDDLHGYEAIAPLNVTHLWNGMSGVSHKTPGLAQWALMNREAFTELNCDGTHVHDAAVQLTLRARPWERIIAISDAIAPAGLRGAGRAGGATEGAADSVGAHSADAGSPTLYGKKLVARGSGLFYADSGVLVGSRFLTRDCIARMVSVLKVPLAQAVAMATLNPARLLGFPRKGALLAGYDGDVALFSRDFGRCAFLSWEGVTLHEDAGAARLAIATPSL